MAVAKQDYYQVLGVDRSATQVELKAAYRKLAVKFHPDHNQDDAEAEEQFKRVAEAYAVLGDSEKRRRYDAFGHAAFGGAGEGSGGAGGADLGGLGDILEGFLDDVFRRRSARRAPKDLRYNLELDFEQAALGTETCIEYERHEICGHCKGERADPSATTPECGACRGRGEVRYQRGFFVASRACSSCDGSGVRSEARCTRCSGSGSQPARQSLEVKIPAGVEDGAVRSVRGAGEQTPYGSGDLHVHIAVKPHPIFNREGSDILCEVPVSFPQAALGDEVDVPTLGGKVSMRLPAGTQSGKVFRLRGKGLPVFGGAGKGDQFVTVVVEVPQKLTARQRELLQELAATMDTSHHHPKTHGFLDKLKHLFD
ncbi:MAG: molecular chaperone DnaJ [Myxococcales bacterium]|nr:molecular chaperone DnaJ [Myxococcales bacterium]